MLFVPSLQGSPMLPVTLAGLGYYLPARRVASAELERQFGLADGWCERLTGIKERRWGSGETSVGMAVQAARMALQHADLDPTEIDLVIGASSAPQQLIPCTAAFVQRELLLPDGGSCCFDVNATCLSFLVALDTASHLIAAGRYRNALIFSSELTAAHVSPSEPESAVLMGDGAAAVIVSRSDDPSRGILLTRFATYSSGAELAVFQGAGTLHPPTDPATTPNMHAFHMDGQAIFRMAGRLLPGFVNGFLAAVGWQASDLDVIVPHQASGPGVRLLWTRCRLPEERVFLNLATRGNCVSASLPLALAEAVHSGRIQRGHRVLLVGTGAGLTLGCTALTF
jgi:3-oxoacyl-[acyl-carrier-protein] synthase III